MATPRTQITFSLSPAALELLNAERDRLNWSRSRCVRFVMEKGLAELQKATTSEDVEF